MNRLFLRIFLWFWLITALIVAGLVVTSPFFTRSRTKFDRWQNRSESTVERVAQEVAGRFDRQTPGGEVPRPERIRRPHGPHPPVNVFVLDPSSRDLYGQPVSSNVARLAAAVRRGGEPRTERTGSRYAAARPVVTGDGTTLVVVAVTHRPPRVVDLLEPKFLLPRLAALLALVGVLTFLLARRLTAPLETLRAATRRLAAGNLAARVGPPMTRRRDELGDLAGDFDTMAERLQALLESQKRLLRDVSHELRSPLARLGVALELARRGEKDEREEALDRIGLEADRLNGMIGQLLTLSRLETGAESLAEEKVELDQLLRAVVDDARFEARRRGIEIDLETVGGCTVTGAPDLLRSALDNALRNAVRYSPEDGRVRVTLAPGEAGEAHISVADQGPGVPEADLPHLFEPFFRTGAARDRGSGGTGLGLAIAAAAIRAHGGRADAANRTPHGLEVHIELPCSE